MRVPATGLALWCQPCCADAGQEDPQDRPAAADAQGSCLGGRRAALRACGGTQGTAPPVSMTSVTRSMSRLPMRPDGWFIAYSSCVSCFACGAPSAASPTAPIQARQPGCRCQQRRMQPSRAAACTQTHALVRCAGQLVPPCRLQARQRHAPATPCPGHYLSHGQAAPRRAHGRGSARATEPGRAPASARWRRCRQTASARRPT